MQSGDFVGAFALPDGDHDTPFLLLVAAAAFGRGSSMDQARARLDAWRIPALPARTPLEAGLSYGVCGEMLVYGATAVIGRLAAAAIMAFSDSIGKKVDPLAEMLRQGHAAELEQQLDVKFFDAWTEAGRADFLMHLPHAATRAALSNDACADAVVQCLAVRPLQAYDARDVSDGVLASREYGFDRGGPLDRQILDWGLREYGPDLTGVVGFGGNGGQRDLLNWASHIERLITVDLFDGPAVDIVGDLHDRSIFEEDSVDGFVAFNVLEHCARPWLVIENIRAWIRPGGLFLTVVPVSQRLHSGPLDCWRILPDGMRELLRDFRDVKVVAPGSAAESIGSLVGLGSGDLLVGIEASSDFLPVCVFAAARA